MNKRAVKIVITAVVIVGGIGYLLLSSFLGSAQTYKMVEELMAEPERWEGKIMRVHGFVEAGSIAESINGQTTERVFFMENKGARIEVTHTGPVPDTFRDRSEVVAKGTVTKDGTEYRLVATELSAKCPSKYEGQPTSKTDYGRVEKPLF